MITSRYRCYLQNGKLREALAKEKILRIQAEKERDEERRARLMAEEELYTVYELIIRKARIMEND